MIDLDGLRIDIRRVRDIVILTLRGEISNRNFLRLEKEALDVLHSGCKKIVMDFTRTTRMSITALGSIISIAVIMKNELGDLAVFGLKPPLSKQFFRVGLHNALKIFDNEDDALREVEAVD